MEVDDGGDELGTSASGDPASARTGPPVSIDPVLPPGRRPRIAAALAIAIVFTSVGVLPNYLTGSLAVQMRSALGLSHAGLGMVTATFFLAAAITSVPMSRMVERVGPVRTMRAVAVFQGLMSVVIALAARSPVDLAVMLGVCGVANGAMQPAVNVFLIERIPPGRQGLAFGVKQAAIPLSTFLGGLAVPAVALTIGWRFGFGLVAVTGVIGLLALPRSSRGAPTRGLGAARAASGAAQDSDPGSGPAPTRASRPARGGPRGSEAGRRAGESGRGTTAGGRVPVARGALVVLGTGIGLGAGAASGMAAFLVTAGVGVGYSPGAAGLVAAAGSFAGFGARVGFGAFVDRSQRSKLRIVAAMLAVGTLGYLGLALGNRVVFLVSALVAYGAGWGWNGLFNYAVVSTHPRAAARATGITQVGAYGGGVVVPVGMGLVAEHLSLGALWVMAAGLGMAAAVAMLVGQRMLRRWLASH